MKGLEFFVEISAMDEATPSGVSAVEFMTKTSSQEPPRALAKTASGGELSRILLAIKQVVGVGQFPRTYLFDEVDTGVSGETAEKVGRRLRSIAGGQQVIGVTHLPQVAAMGEAHFFIAKDLSASSPGAKATATNIARTRVTELDGQERIREIARLISGEKLNSTSMAHAQTLLNDAARIKLDSTVEKTDRVGKSLPRSAGQKPVEKSMPTTLSTKDSTTKSPKSRREADRRDARKKPTATN
jgi:DNA repair protein RecN (Recombination protein N)